MKAFYFLLLVGELLCITGFKLNPISVSCQTGLLKHTCFLFKIASIKNLQHIICMFEHWYLIKIISILDIIHNKSQVCHRIPI
jgi:hypothetical protein